ISPRAYTLQIAVVHWNWMASPTARRVVVSFCRSQKCNAWRPTSARLEKRLGITGRRAIFFVCGWHRSCVDHSMIDVCAVLPCFVRMKGSASGGLRLLIRFRIVRPILAAHQGRESPCSIFVRIAYRGQVAFERRTRNTG
ncbi:unnamed protein product, partial [Sphacelaria rigidula]